MRVLVCNGWAAGPEAWELCSFQHDWIFSYIEQIDGLADKILAEFDEAVLVGFSMGGLTAMRLLLEHPEKVKGLILVSATARMMEEKNEGWRGMSPRRFEALRLGTEITFRNDPSPIYAPKNLKRGLELLAQCDLRQQLRAAKLNYLPVSVFQSEKDGIVRPENAIFFKEVFPQAKITMIHGNEHNLPITEPEKISATISECVLKASKQAKI